MSVPSAFDANTSPVAGSKRRAVDAGPDRHRRDDLPRPVVRDGHHAAPTSAEQSLMRHVDRHRHGILARRGRPASGHTQRLRIDLDDFAGVREVRVHLAVAGGDAVLRLAAQVDVRHQLSGRRIDDRRRVRVAVECEHAIRRRVVDDRVGILGRVDLAEGLERLQVEHDHGAVVA